MRLAYRHLRRLLFALDAERAHELSVGGLGWACRLRPIARRIQQRCAVIDPRLEQKLWELDFANPVGLAAGFDKNGVAVTGLATLGFGFLEVGTVTPKPEAGNPRPRVFRYPEYESLQNALGFNNAGLKAMRRSLSGSRPCGTPVGVNIGKNRSTANAAAGDDYAALLTGLSGLCDYFVVNVSSPNTPGLRDLQTRRGLTALISRGRQLVAQPILVKLAPELDLGAAVELAQAAVGAGAGGLVLTNTTTDYSLLPGARAGGGLSGRVLRERSFEMLQAVASELFGRCLLISVGGIDSADEAYRRLRAGASLVQIFTALVFRGPGLVREINRGLLERLDRDGARGLPEVIGVDRRRAARRPGILRGAQDTESGGAENASLDRLAVALDTSDWARFRAWCAFFGPKVGVLKVGLEAYVRWGPRAVQEARRQAQRVLLDLKLHDIPNTVRGAVVAALELGVDYLTVHAAGGASMLEAACEAASEEIKILAVTLLTHLGREDLVALDLPGGGRQRVVRWAGLARRAGCAGVVCSPWEAATLRRQNPRPFLLVTPGIRSGRDAAADDQRRTAVAGRALAAGADLLVVGRPLTRAADPEEALRALAREMAGDHTTKTGRST